MRIDGKYESFVYLRSRRTKEVNLNRKEIRRVYILNCTDSDSVRIDLINTPSGHLTATTLDCSLQSKGNQRIRGGDRVHLDQRVPQGGLIVIEWLHTDGADGASR